MLTLTSPAFGPGAAIPVRYAMRAVPGGLNVSIPYAWSDLPTGTASLALVLVDRSPVAKGWAHWVVVDIAPSASALPEGASNTSSMPAGARELVNSFGATGYGGPQPPPGTGAHEYEATLYALDVPTLGLRPAATLEAFNQALDGHVLADATYSGSFGR
jgi:Raf kinase inhibitor-like YbhB/YbcL family protein